MIKEAVSQTTLGQARLVFWRDAVKDIFAVSHASGVFGFFQYPCRTSPRGTQLRLDSTKPHRRVTWRHTTFRGLSKPGSVYALDLVLLSQD